ncbi:hypothetical protein EJ04DRAFT_449906, partial [Polyplosphaeria fusca]
LNLSNDKVRLISLMPRKAEDETSFSIFHAPLIPPQAQSTPGERLGYQVHGHILIRALIKARTVGNVTGLS